MGFEKYVGIIIALLTGLLTVISIWNRGEKGIGRVSKAILTCIFAVVIALIIVTTYYFVQGGEDEGATEPTPPTTHAAASTGPEETTPPATEPPVPEPTIPNNLRVGDTFTFGTYEQDNKPSNGKESIEWLVLAREEGRILVLSVYGLDSQRYNKTYKTVTWATSNIRTWLNDGFYNDAFTAEEQELILLSKLDPGDSPDKDCDSGTSTEDHVFLLSWKEMKTYIQENALIDTSNTLLCRPTEYAVKEKDAYKNEKGYGWWWLRTSVINNCYAASVNSDASIDLENGKVNSPNAVIRPAMWVIVE